MQYAGTTSVTKNGWLVDSLFGWLANGRLDEWKNYWKTYNKYNKKRYSREKKMQSAFLGSECCATVNSFESNTTCWRTRNGYKWRARWNVSKKETRAKWRSNTTAQPLLIQIVGEWKSGGHWPHTHKIDDCIWDWDLLKTSVCVCECVCAAVQSASCTKRCCSALPHAT